MRRKLSVIERGFWFGGEYCFNFAMAACIKGQFSIEELKAALLKIRKKYPILGVHIEVDEKNNIWFSDEDVPEFQLRIVPRQNNEHWIQEVERELLVPFSRVKGPLIRFTVVQSEEISDLLIICDHVNSDGLSVTYILRDILTFMANPEKEIEIMPLIHDLEDILPEDLIAKLPNKAEGAEILTTEDKIVKLFNKDKISIVPWSLSESQTSSLISKCKNENVSVHQAICTLFLVAINEIEPKYLSKNITIYSPVNIRNRLSAEVGEAYGAYYSTAIQTKLKYSKENGFWKTAQMFQKRLKRQLKNETLFSLFFLERSMGQEGFDNAIIQAFKEVKSASGITVSNLGKLQLPEIYGNFKLNSIYGPMMDVFHYEKTLGISTMGNQMYLTLTFRENIIDRGTIEKIRNKTLEIIDQF